VALSGTNELNLNMALANLENILTAETEDYEVMVHAEVGALFKS
jgi:hypothetical protein